MGRWTIHHHGWELRPAHPRSKASPRGRYASPGPLHWRIRARLMCMLIRFIHIWIRHMAERQAQKGKRPGRQGVRKTRGQEDKGPARQEASKARGQEDKGPGRHGVRKTRCQEENGPARQGATHRKLSICETIGIRSPPASRLWSTQTENLERCIKSV